MDRQINMTENTVILMFSNILLFDLVAKGVFLTIYYWILLLNIVSINGGENWREGG